MTLETDAGVEQIIQDVRYAFRTFVRHPGFALTAILALALGIGANTAVFSVVYAVLVKPLPFADPARLIYAHDTYPAVPLASVSWPKFVALRDGNRTLSSLAAVAPGTVTVTGRGEPQQIVAYRVSGDFFTVLGVPPAAGRLINTSDDVPNGGNVIALGYALWQRLYGGDPRAIGQPLIVDGAPCTVVAVMPPSFTYPTGADAWVPLALPAKFQGNNFLRLIGRLKPDVSIEQATDDLHALSTAYNQANALSRDVKVYPLHEYLVARNRRMLLVMQGAVAFVLLIACANVANLLLARSVSRVRELAIRAAIGAGRFRLVRQLLTESLLLSAAGSILGVLLASWLLRLFLALAPANFAGVQTVTIDLRVLGFTLAIAIFTGLLFGLAPARRGSVVDANSGLRDTGTRGATSAGAKGASRILVVAEIGLAMILVIGAGLMVKSLLRLQAQDAGFNAERVMTFQLNLPSPKYSAPERLIQTYTRAIDDIRSMPGVTAAGAINMIPLANFGMNGDFSIVGRPPFAQQGRAPIVEYRVVTPGYFAAMGIPIERGADFSNRDTATSERVVIINEAMAKQFWPDGNPVGEHLQLGWDPKTVARRIVGVVGSTRSQAVGAPPVSETFVPYTQAPLPGMGVVMRTDAADSATLLPAVRQRLAAIDSQLPIVRPQTMQTLVDASSGSTRLSSVLTSVFAMLAALLASVGIYSLIAYSVAERTREIGIRVALGADRGSVVRLVVGEGLTLGGIGIAVGLLGAWLLTGTLKTLLYDVSPIDVPVLAATCAAVLLVAALAAYVPARRALRVDPMVALRTD
jgi:putative ABC transport system permease protein